MNHRQLSTPVIIFSLIMLSVLAGCRGPSDPEPGVTSPITSLSQDDLENISDIQFAYVGLLFAIAVDPDLQAQLDSTGTVTVTPADFDVTDPTASGSIVVTRRTLTVDGALLDAIEMNFNAAGNSTGNIDSPDTDPYIAGSTDDEDAVFPDISVIRGTVVITTITPTASASTYRFDVKTVRVSADADEATTGTVTVNGAIYNAAEVEAAIEALPRSRAGSSFILPGSSLSIEADRPGS